MELIGIKLAPEDFYKIHLKPQTFMSYEVKVVEPKNLYKDE